MLNIDCRYEFLENSLIFLENQSGFRNHKGTSKALQSLASNIYEKLDERYYVLCMFLDVIKAFDSVNHKL